MFEWSEIKIAKAQQEYLRSFASHDGEKCNELSRQGLLIRAAVWFVGGLGNWLLHLGLRLQAKSAEMAASLGGLKSQPVNSPLPQLEQKC